LDSEVWQKQQQHNLEWFYEEGFKTSWQRVRHQNDWRENK
jgi:hypothetical protein